MEYSEMTLEQLEVQRHEILHWISVRRTEMISLPATEPVALEQWPASYNDGLSELTGVMVYRGGYSLPSRGYGQVADIVTVLVFRIDSGEYWIHVACNGYPCQAKLLGVPHTGGVVDALLAEERCPVDPSEGSEDELDELCQRVFGVGIDKMTFSYDDF